jgi:hypothetical protein
VNRMTGDTVPPHGRAPLGAPYSEPHRHSHDGGVSDVHTPQHADGSPFRRGNRRKENDADAICDEAALGALLAALCLLSLCVPPPVQAQGTFTTASLQGTYAYVNNTGNVGSLGLITFDGSGELTAEIKVNLPDEMGGRTVVPTSGPGTYTVDAAGTGVATIEFSTGEATYDFVITQVAGKGKGDRALATEVFAVARAGGLAGQLIAPMWKRISD